jgi:aminoglycoside phosphotransferase (APT) family kinase protein
MPTEKVDVNVSLVSQLVTAQYPQWADLPIRPVENDGWDNRTFRLGEDMTVRLPSAEAYTGQVEKEQWWLPRLAPHLPLPIPVQRIENLHQFATTLAQFLVALQRIDPTGGPPPGRHNFFRGGPLTIYDTETRDAIATLHGKVDSDAVADVWETALKATWDGTTVWFHGDVEASNLLVNKGRLSAVIDFGCSGVGDPACDLTIAWTLFSEERRETFRSALPVDAATWARGRGWALWKGLITLAKHINTNPLEAGKARRVIDEVLADHKHAT